jgi:hypothetical protein
MQQEAEEQNKTDGLGKVFCLMLKRIVIRLSLDALPRGMRDFLFSDFTKN